MCIPSRGSEANHRLSIDTGGGRGGRRVYLSGGLIREGPGAVSHSCRPVPMGTFASSEEDVAFHRPFESATSMRRWAEAFCLRCPGRVPSLCLLVERPVYSPFSVALRGRPQLHVERAITMYDTFQSYGSARLYPGIPKTLRITFFS